MPLLMPLFDDAVLKRRAEIVAALKSIVPGEGVIASEEAMRPYESDGLTAYRQLPMVVVLPETTAQVAAVLRFCHREGIKVVPRGAGTSLSGGALPLGDGVLLGLAKFNRIREIDYRQPRRRGRARRHQSRGVAGGRRGRLLLRAGSVVANRLHHRRQCRGEFRRRALPQIRHDHQQCARLRTRPDDRRDRAARRQASRCRRLRSPRHRHRLGGAAWRRHRSDGAHLEETADRARGADRLCRVRRRRRMRRQDHRRGHHSRRHGNDGPSRHRRHGGIRPCRLSARRRGAVDRRARRSARRGRSSARARARTSPRRAAR